MDKPPAIIEGAYRVIGALPSRAPFWGPNAGFGNALYALICGFTCVGCYQAEMPERAARWRHRIVFCLIVAALAITRH